MSQSVVVIGNFDGVHLGHRAVLAHARGLEPGLPVIAMTFWPHPLSVVRPGHEPKLLCDLDERVELLRAAGADRVEVVAFTKAFSQQSPEDFVSSVLLPLSPARVVVGQNFRFGHRAAGNVDTLRELGRGRFEVTAIDLVTSPLHADAAPTDPLHASPLASPVHSTDGAERTSSTRIREALAEGDLEAAEAMLGRPFSFAGTVVRGDQRGRELGFPTANLDVSDLRAAPADGVYAGWLSRIDRPDRPALPAAISVGRNPTFDGRQLRVESYVLDRTDLELYGVRIRVEFVSRIRGQVKFDGIEALIAQMNDDVDRIRTVLGVRS
ncbi:bifunctional riboflavin kinase/FAD synthetase [Raineyella sp. LH-20]|uniref:bifunctional riboflavin kinase/FAD synthetase n=1 Tax=Raineyella sp. LH-20 TaxID=3081204 RepID=UPI002952D727|nr:bifunctional riboflavin kinase/FAD synthetase [Raineyella sp. LH-20]WOP18441.1 bifunctional riboflavin kinase/FAD synthetase [Raineyella sp. LH-20]